MWVIFRQTWGYLNLKNGKPYKDKKGMWVKKTMDPISQTRFSQLTGIKRRRIWTLIKRLLEKNLIIKNDDGFISKYGIQKDWEQWKLSPKKMILSLKMMTPVIKNDDKTVIKNDAHKRKKENITKEKISCPKKEYSFSDEHLSLASYLTKLILENKPDYHFTGNNYKEKWANEIRLMVERDNRKINKIREVITFSQKHHFWKRNILSADKLRSQFDRLEMEMKDEEGGTYGKSKQFTTKHPRQDWEESEKYREVRKK